MRVFSFPARVTTDVQFSIRRDATGKNAMRDYATVNKVVTLLAPLHTRYVPTYREASVCLQFSVVRARKWQSNEKPAARGVGVCTVHNVPGLCVRSSQTLEWRE